MAEPIKSDPNARFDRARQQAKRDVTGQTQQNEEALKRRFASLGMQNSGAAIKQEQVSKEQGQGVLQRRLEGIQGQQEEETQRRDEIKQAREYATSERVAGQAFGAEQAGIGRSFAAEQSGLGRSFAAEQADLQRGFTTGEREAGQAFGAEQAGIQRGFLTDERKAQQLFAFKENVNNRNLSREQAANAIQAQSDMLDKQQKFQQDVVLKMQNSQFQKQFDLALEQFELDKDVTAFNQRMAEAENVSFSDQIANPFKGMFG